MFPYLLLIFVAILFSFVAVKAPNKDTPGVHIGESDYVRENNVALFAFFAVLFFVLAFRDTSIGRDLASYEMYFSAYRRLKPESILKVNMDSLYVWFNWLVGKFTDSYQVFLAVVAALCLIPIYFQYSKDRRYSFLKIILFMNMSVFTMLFSGLRQALAVSVGMVAYEFVKKKKLVAFLLTVLVAVGFHHTGFMVLLLYPLYHLKLKRKYLYFVFPIMAVIFIFNRQIFSSLSFLAFQLFGEKYDVVTSSTGAYTMLFLFLAFTVFSFVVVDESKLDAETYGLRNFLIFATMVQCFAPIHNLSMRMNYYFIIFIPMVIPKVLSCPERRYADVTTIARYVLVVFFLGYYLITAYESCRTGISALDTYPYIPFWETTV